MYVCGDVTRRRYATCPTQALAREITTSHTPVFMSALAQLPAITAAFGQTEKIAIFTANSETLTPMKNLIRDECGVDPDEERFVIVGCQDVPGFEAVAAGEKVDVAAVTPGMVNTGLWSHFPLWYRALTVRSSHAWNPPP